MKRLEKRAMQRGGVFLMSNKSCLTTKAVILAVALSGGSVKAETPERMPFYDRNGVNILNGSGFSLPDSVNSFEIGSLVYDRAASSDIYDKYPSIYHNSLYFGGSYIQLTQDSAPYMYWTELKRFQKVGTTTRFNSTDGDGSYIIQIATNIFEYYQRGGAVVTYDNYAGSQPTNGGNWHIKSIRKPTGEIIKFTVRLHDNGSGVSPRYNEAGLQTLSSSLGHVIQFEYASDTDVAGINAPAAYKNIVAVNGYNQAYEFCPDGAKRCGAIAGRPRVSFSSTSTSSSGSMTITNALGQTSSFSWDQTGAGIGYKNYHVRFPRGYTANSDDITVRIRNNSQDANVGTIYDLTYGGSQTWSYFGGTVTAPDLSTEKYTSTLLNSTNPQIFRVTSYRDQLGNVTAYRHDAGYRIDEVTSPEGDKLKVTWDTLGRRTELRRISKTPGSPGDIVETRSYPSDCSNLTVCGLPLRVVDGRLNATDFTYDQTHGGVLTESGPADPQGIRPVKRYGYVQKSASIIGPGGSVQVNPPVWVLSTIKQCRSTATDIPSGTCAGGAADEIVTTYEYSNSASPHNLDPLGIRVSSADGVRVTCFTYDPLGRVTSQTAPAANRSTCQ